MHIIAENWIWIVAAAWYGMLLLVAMGVGMYNGLRERKDSDLEAVYNEDEYRLDRRRVKGGAVFNDVIWEAKGEEERRMRRFLARISEPNVSDDDRRVYAEEIATCQRQIDRYHRLLNMKEPTS